MKVEEHKLVIAVKGPQCTALDDGVGEVGQPLAEEKIRKFTGIPSQLDWLPLLKDKEELGGKAGKWGQNCDAEVIRI